jgi:hypothetical protein
MEKSLMNREKDTNYQFPDSFPACGAMPDYFGMRLNWFLYSISSSD